MEDFDIDLDLVSGISSFTNDKTHEIVGFTLNLKNGTIKNVIVNYRKDKQLVERMLNKYDYVKKSICHNEKNE